MRNFKAKDFDGCGQYLVRTRKKPDLNNPGFLSTIMYKVAYQFSGPTWGTHQIVFVSMADGLIHDKFLNYEKKEDPNEEDHWYYFSDPDQDLGGPNRAKQKLVDYLNNPKICEPEYRFATHEELMLVFMHQDHKTKPIKE